MKFKSIICMILICVLTLSMFSACGGDTTPPSGDGATPPAGDSTTPNDPNGGETPDPDENPNPDETPNPDDGEGDKENEDDNSQEQEEMKPLSKDKTYNILFIGNSYTKRSNMPTDIFLPMAKAAGYDVNVKAILNGGHTLLAFADHRDTYGSQVAAALNPSNTVKYDYVIIQEQSLRPVTETGKFYDGVRALVEMIRAAGATPVLYSTWGRKTGSADLTALNMTNESMTWKLAAVSEAIGKELNIPVAYTGLAFYDAYTNCPAIELYDSDLYHPTYNGSYLVAATLFSRIFGVDPTEVNYVGDLTQSAANILRGVAKSAVFNTPEIPEQYKTSSEGVESEKSETLMTKNLTKLPNAKLISILTGGNYPNGKSFSGILGTKNQIASAEYATSGLTDAQKADIADTGYGVSIIGAENMDSGSKGYTTAVENLVNGHWGGSLMSCITFDDKMYDVNGNVAADGKYRALITLNFGKMCTFSAMGFASGNMKGFPGAADVYVSTDGVNWTLVPSACWDAVNGEALVACSDAASLADPWNGNTTDTICLFDMAEVEGVYIRIGVVTGRYDNVTKYNTINTREILVYGEYKEEK